MTNEIVIDNKLNVNHKYEDFVSRVFQTAVQKANLSDQENVQWKINECVRDRASNTTDAGLMKTVLPKGNA